jgi:hypothetical protein
MMEWADIASLYRYWRESPPVHELVGDYLGRRPSRGKAASRDERPVLELTPDQIRQGFAMGVPEPIGVG